MSLHGDRVGVVRPDDDLAATREIDDGHGARLTRRKVKVVVFKQSPTCTRRLQHDLPREDVGRDLEPALDLACLELGAWQMQMALAHEQARRLLPGCRTQGVPGKGRL